MATTPRKLISIITPVFNEAESLADCYAAIRRIFTEALPEYDYEHIFADNASTDGTPAGLRRLAAEDPRHVKVILNARNFGILRSAFNALLSASGAGIVVLFPVDLQDPPEVIIEFVRAWEQGYEVVYGIRQAREEGRVMQILRRIYYRVLNRLANIDIPCNVGSFQFIDRQVLEALRRHDDYYPHIPGMIASCGFRSTGVPYTWRARTRGTTKNRIYHLVDEALNSMISFTRIPMRVCMGVGLVLSFLSIGYAFLSLLLAIVYYRQVSAPGIATLIVAIFFFSGVQLFFFGVLGEYISAIHFQVRKRPLVVERERINFNPVAADRDP